MSGSKRSLSSVRYRQIKALHAVSGLALSLFLCLGASSVWGSTVEALALDRLLSMAERVVHAEVVSLQSQMIREGVIRTSVCFRVREEWKGEGTPSFCLERPGGTAGGVHSHVHGEPRWVIGNEVVLFLGRDAGHGPSLPGLSQAVFDVQYRRGEPPQVSRDLAGLAFWRRGTTEPHLARVAPMQQLLDPRASVDLAAVVPLDDLREAVTTGQR